MSENIFVAESTRTSESTIEATWHNGVLNVSVENPWAGSTDTGFGATCFIDLDRETARRFGEWLLKITTE